MVSRAGESTCTHDSGRGGAREEARHFQGIAATRSGMVLDQFVKEIARDRSLLVICNGDGPGLDWIGLDMVQSRNLSNAPVSGILSADCLARSQKPMFRNARCEVRGSRFG